MIKFILLGIAVLAISGKNCSMEFIAQELDKKIVDTKFAPIGENFYLHDSPEKQEEIHQIIKNKEIICGF